MRRPTSTYRLQLHAKFGFVQAQQCLRYLDELGVSDIYSSPYLKAGRGSVHGYDVVDPTVLNDELGASAAWQAFSDEMLERGLGHVLDIVPNHMAAVEGNLWWWDVLESGASSPYAGHFDIDWNPPKESLRGRVLLPVLGGQFSELLERGELNILREGALVSLAYWDHRFPIAPPTLAPLLVEAGATLGEEPALQELRSIVRALENLPDLSQRPRPERLARNEEIIVVRRRLAALLTSSEPVASALDEVLRQVNGTVGEPRSFDRLERLISEQHYRLADWHVAAEEINYRRFFDVNELVALHMEDATVFLESHAFILKLIEEGRASGLRIDHADGLRDPERYFQRLREHTGKSGACYIVAEKILGVGERLNPRWPIDGTTGYDFMASLSALFVDPRGEQPLTALYRELTGDERTYEEHARDARRLIMRASLPSEVHTLARALERLSEHGRRPHDFTRSALQTAIAETVAAFPFYRTYLRADGSSAPTDRRTIETAISIAKSRNPGLDAAFDFLREVLLLEPLAGADEHTHKEQLRFVLRFQQLTPPMMAKGVEDTAFYTYRRMASLNDVGGDPARFGIGVDEFHARNLERRRDWPLSMLASSTHDNKRGEDVRARLSVLSEVPREWANAVAQWSEKLSAYKSQLGDARAPSRGDEYLFYQTVLGVFPFRGELDGIWIDRIAAYMRKAAREAKEHTNWTAPDTGYETALEKFVRAALADSSFRESLAAFASKILQTGALYGLGQAALKLCSPGVADTYQGCEQWNLSLVDPDNRRPVDYECLSHRLEGLRSGMGTRGPAALCQELLGRYQDSDVKHYVTHLLLQARRSDPELFLDGDYQPLKSSDQIVAFTRTRGQRKLVCAVPRLVHKIVREAGWPLGAVWHEQALQLDRPCTLRNVFTQERIEARGPLRLAALFQRFPIAVLVTE